MDMGQYYFNLEEVDIHEYLEEIVLEYKDLLDSYNIRIRLECMPGLTGYFDRSLVSSIIKTIISNAYQYTGNENVRISRLNDDTGNADAFGDVPPKRAKKGAS